MNSSSKFPKTLVALVDDNRDYLLMAKQLIEMKGYPVITFDSPFDALAFVMDGLERPAIFMIDYDMSEHSYNGNQLIKHINKVKTQTILSFLVTAHNDHKIFAEALENDAFGFFSKLPSQEEEGSEFNLGDLYIKYIERAERFLQNELMLAERLDALTGVYGIYDREGGRQRFRHVWRAARLNCTTTSCLFVDVNGLKAANESYGYPAGDKIILALGKVLQQHRTSDYVVRFGGDEFLVVLQATTRTQARQALCRLKKEATAQKIELAPDVLYQMTLSGGIYSILPKDLGEEPDLVYDELVKLASSSERKNKKKIRQKKK
jgi:two-component system, cell cycle response regulator